MATAKQAGVILELNTEEASFLAGLLEATTDWEVEPIAETLFYALDPLTDRNTEFELVGTSYVSKK